MSCVLQLRATVACENRTCSFSLFFKFIYSSCHTDGNEKILLWELTNLWEGKSRIMNVLWDLIADAHCNQSKLFLLTV